MAIFLNTLVTWSFRGNIFKHLSDLESSWQYLIIKIKSCTLYVFVKNAKPNNIWIFPRKIDKLSFESLL